MKIYDISRMLSASTAVWPNDQSFAARWSMRMAEGYSVNVGAFEMSTHAGTHVDAPLHFQEEAATVDRFDLDVFVGPAYVVEIRDAEAVDVKHLDRLDFTGVPRVLFKTKASALNDDVFEKDFVFVQPSVVRYLAEFGVVLIGTDAPSVDPFDSAALPAHHELARCGIVNLENLMLKDVQPGLYRLIALPLKLKGMDAAPVRAILTQRFEADTAGASH